MRNSLLAHGFSPSRQLFHFVLEPPAVFGARSLACSARGVLKLSRRTRGILPVQTAASIPEQLWKFRKKWKSVILRMNIAERERGSLEISRGCKRSAKKRAQKKPALSSRGGDSGCLLFFLDDNFDVGAHLAKQFHRNFILAHQLDGIGQHDFAFVYRVALGGERIGDVAGRHRAE